MNTRLLIGAPSQRDTHHAVHEVLPAAAFVVLWSTGYLAGKIAVAYAAPFTALTLRFAGAAVLFAALAWMARAQWPPLPIVGHSVVVGLLMLALQFGGVYGAFALGASSGLAALVIGSMPLATSFAAALLGRRQPASHWIGLLLGAVGVWLVLHDRLNSALGSPAAGIALFLGLCGITLGTLYQQRHASSLDLNVGLLVQNLTAVIVLSPLALIHEHLRFTITPAFAASMLWLVLVNSGASFALLFVLLRRGAATRVATLFYLMIPVTAVMSSLVMHEPLSPTKVLGFAVVATGVYVSTRRP